jgi:outer membrane protein TolC
MEKLVGVFLGLAFWITGFTQTTNFVNLEQCYAWAKEAYPLREKLPLLEQASQLRIDQIRTERLPQLETQLQASWQSEVVDFPLEIPGMGDLLDLPLYRAQATLQAGYLIYDGGLAKARIEQERRNLAADKQGVAADLYKLKETVNLYFFNTLLLQEKQQILQTTLGNLNAQLQRIEAGIRNGVALPSAATQIQVEILKVQAQIAETNLTEESLRKQLSDLTGQPEETLKSLELPDIGASPRPLNRPELVFIALQKESLAQREALLEAARRPKVNAFVSGGLGYPNPLNFFDEEIAPFAQVGLQAKWTIYDWGKLKKDRELLSVQQSILDNQRKVLETNLDRADAHFLQQMASLEQQLIFDQQIAELQANLLQTISAQVDNGVATTTDYLLQSNAETLARLQLKTHEVQLAQVKAGYWVHRGR